MAFQREICESSLRASKSAIIARAVDESVSGTAPALCRGFGLDSEVERASLRSAISYMMTEIFDYDFAIKVSPAVIELEDLLANEWEQEVKEMVSKMTYEDIVAVYARLNDKEVIKNTEAAENREKFLAVKQQFDNLVLPILSALANCYFGDGSSVKISAFDSEDTQYFAEVVFPWGEEDSASIRYTLKKFPYSPQGFSVDCGIFLNGKNAFNYSQVVELNEPSSADELKEHLFSWVLGGDLDFALRVAKQNESDGR